MKTQYTLQYRDVNVSYATGVHAVRGVSFAVREKECLALVGESGCGKTTMAHAALGLLPQNTRLSGSIVIDGIEAIGASQREMRRLRGVVAGFVVQDPCAACNPLAKVAAHVAEAWRAHRLTIPPEAIVQAVNNLGISDPERMIRYYPHQWSGGMLQRATIAAAAAHHPQLIIADEPTSALDADRADSTLDALKQTGAALLLVSHDLELVARHADRIATCYAGQIVEIGRSEEILKNPKHPYTRGLLRAIPGRQGTLPEVMPGYPPDLRTKIAGCAFVSRCARKKEACLTVSPPMKNGVACLQYSRPEERDSKTLSLKTGTYRVIASSISSGDPSPSTYLAEMRNVSKTYKQGRHLIQAVRSASLKVRPGEIVGISGPSGCGKSTLLRLLATLDIPDSGEIYLDGRLTAKAGSRHLFSDLSRSAYLMPIFQDPVSSLDARWPIWRTIIEPLTAPHRKTRLQKRKYCHIARELLKQVGLEMLDLESRPAELSVGQCQRVAIARVLAARPKIMIADEPTSALDASVSASILHLLADFVGQGSAIVMVSHDRPMLNAICHRVREMQAGVLL